MSASTGTVACYPCSKCGAWVPIGSLHQCLSPTPMSVPSVFGWPAVTKGCICPPGANATCEATDCPRKSRPESTYAR